jgi:hypothetical protein
MDGTVDVGVKPRFLVGEMGDGEEGGVEGAVKVMKKVNLADFLPF